MVAFNNKWLELKDSNNDRIGDWAEKIDEREFKCLWCFVSSGRSITYSTKGKGAFMDHARTDKHKSFSKIRSSNCQSRFRVVPVADADAPAPKVSVQMYTIPDKTIADELLWVMNIIRKKDSFLSAEADTEVLRFIAPNDCPKFSLDKNKVASYVNEALGPHFKLILYNEVQNEFFTILFDETKNNKHEDEIQIRAKFWSQLAKRVVCVHIKTFYLQKKDAASIVDLLKKAMEEFNMEAKNLVMLSSDGPNVNKRVMRLFDAYMEEERGFSLMMIGFCRCHNLCNSTKHGMKCMEIRKLAFMIYDYFKDGSNWRKIQALSDGKIRKFKKHLEIRWTTLGPACEIIAENWSLLKIYCKHLGDKNPESLEKIRKMIAKNTMYAEAVYVTEICAIIDPVIKILEETDALVVELDQVFVDLYQKLLIKISKSEYVNRIIEQQSFDGFGKEIFLKAYESEAVDKAMEIEKVSQKEAVIFKGQLLQNTKSMVEYLFSKNLRHNFFRFCAALSASQITTTAAKAPLLSLADLLKIPFDR
jgi:hypothetical protein